MYEAERAKFKPQWTPDIAETVGHLQRKTKGSEKSQPKREAMWFVGSKVLGAHIILPSPPDSRHRVVRFNVFFHGICLALVLPFFFDLVLIFRMITFMVCNCLYLYLILQELTVNFVFALSRRGGFGFLRNARTIETKCIIHYDN